MSNLDNLNALMAAMNGGAKPDPSVVAVALIGGVQNFSDADIERLVGKPVPRDELSDEDRAGLILAATAQQWNERIRAGYVAAKSAEAAAEALALLA